MMSIYLLRCLAWDGDGMGLGTRSMSRAACPAILSTQGNYSTCKPSIRTVHPRHTLHIYSVSPHAYRCVAGFPLSSTTTISVSDVSQLVGSAVDQSVSFMCYLGDSSGCLGRQ